MWGKGGSCVKQESEFFPYGVVVKGIEGLPQRLAYFRHLVRVSE